MTTIKNIFGMKDTPVQNFINPIHQSTEQTEDFAVKKVVNMQEGTVEKIPVNDNDIINFSSLNERFSVMESVFVDSIFIECSTTPYALSSVFYDIPTDSILEFEFYANNEDVVPYYFYMRNDDGLTPILSSLSTDTQALIKFRVRNQNNVLFIEVETLPSGAGSVKDFTISSNNGLQVYLYGSNSRYNIYGKIYKYLYR